MVSKKILADISRMRLPRMLLSVLLLTICLTSLTVVYADQLSFTLYTDKESYVLGDRIVFAGHVYPPHAGDKVVVALTSPTDNAYAFDTLTDENGNFMIVTLPAGTAGAWYVFAYVERLEWEGDSIETMIMVTGDHYEDDLWEDDFYEEPPIIVETVTTTITKYQDETLTEFKTETKTEIKTETERETVTTTFTYTQPLTFFQENWPWMILLTSLVAGVTGIMLASILGWWRWFKARGVPNLPGTPCKSKCPTCGKPCIHNIPPGKYFHGGPCDCGGVSVKRKIVRRREQRHTWYPAQQR
jgi:hypothetical protein